jgi:hypothetical protein
MRIEVQISLSHKKEKEISLPPITFIDPTLLSWQWAEGLLLQ